MRPSENEIKEEIKSKQKIISKLKGQRRELEQQMANFGSLYVPPYIMQQITELTDQIAQKEQDLAQLRTQSVETTLPVAEVEYRAVVAEAWSKSSGWLSAVDEARLELERLRLGITEQRSKEHHDAVRSRIAVETLLDLELNYIQGEPDIRSSAVQRIIRAFRLDPHKSEDLLRQNIDEASIEVLVEWLKITRTIWRSEEEYTELDSLFKQLMNEKRTLVGKPQILSNTPQSWIGEYSYGNHSKIISMKLTIEQLDKNELIGRAEYPTLDTTTRVTGQVLGLDSSSVAAHKWTLIPDYDLEETKTLIKFTEPYHIHGHHSQLYGWYYGVIKNDGKLIGIWFPRDTETTSQANFK